MVQGSPGAGIESLPIKICPLNSFLGRSLFLNYLAICLLRQSRPLIWCGVNSRKEYNLFFCKKGVFRLHDNALVNNFLGSEASQGLYILADANTVKPIPLIKRVLHNSFRPTLVYAASPNDEESSKLLEQNLNYAFHTFIMNPWTLFELELV